ncbi:MAG: CRISPR-associated endonuclease Cas2 [Firmicutes bacterium]|nr:CRISPR-associated endonuclease Cas2 [Bacillota bacterium]
MRVFVMFDLPTGTKKERGEATRFRNALIKHGFYMLQYSVYVRLCANVDAAKASANTVHKLIPMKGAVRIMIVTERQYSSMYVLLGPKHHQESFLDDDGNLFL